MSFAIPAKRPAKLTCLFVGGFGLKLNQEVFGGQLSACKALLESDLGNHVEWVLLDSTQESIPPPSIWRRGWLALKRLVVFFREARPGRVQCTLIFIASGLSFLEKGIMILLARHRGIRIVLCPRAGQLIDEINKGGWWKWFIRLVFKASDVIICQSDFWRVYFDRSINLPSKKFVVIPNWIALPQNEVGAASPDSIETVKLLYLGWIDKNKGIFDLIDAVSLVRNQLSKARFIVCGEGEAKDTAIKKITQAGLDDLFEFRGWVSGSAKVEALKECSIIVLASHREGFPNTLLEGMSSGLAAVATRVGAVPDLIRHEETGLLLEPGDISALGSSLVRLVSDRKLRLKCSVAGKDFVYRNHDIKQLWPLMLEAMRGS